MADDDGTLTRAELDRLCRSCEVVLQEKLDGTNVGVFFQSASRPVCQKRAGLLGGRERRQYNVFRNWVWEHVERLWTLVGTQWVLFGEWLWQTHALYYDALPNLLVAFDLLDRASGRFSVSAEVRKAVSGSLAVVPELWRGRIRSAEELLSLIPRLLVRSAFASAKPEGVYVRFETEGELIARAKYRRPGFTPGWKGRPRLNRLIDSSNESGEACFGQEGPSSPPPTRMSRGASQSLSYLPEKDDRLGGYPVVRTRHTPGLRSSPGRRLASGLSIVFGEQHSDEPQAPLWGERSEGGQGRLQRGVALGVSGAGASIGASGRGRTRKPLRGKGLEGWRA